MAKNHLAYEECEEKGGQSQSAEVTLDNKSFNFHPTEKNFALDEISEEMESKSGMMDNVIIIHVNFLEVGVEPSAS